MMNHKKMLSRVRLVNWHYFENETIGFNGSTLISGENTSGKSTILDAIQLVLTTNTRKFNVAANEKGKRDLKGYVRCKMGNVGEAYLRKNAVIANVALEFYEEKTDKYFVQGVHITSADEESEVKTRWYVEECRLEKLSFITGNRPSTADEFRINGKKLSYIQQKNQTRDRFKRRMGNLEDRFFDVIPKSLAFKPMDNVKDFINKFVLSEDKIDIEGLRSNIETLSELERIIDKANRELSLLSQVTDKYDVIKQKEREILVNQLLLIVAQGDALNIEVKSLAEKISKNTQYYGINQEQIKELEEQLRVLEEEIVAIQVSIQSNEANNLVTVLQGNVTQLISRIDHARAEEVRLNTQIGLLNVFLEELKNFEATVLTNDEVQILKGAYPITQKIDLVQKLEEFLATTIESYRLKEASLRNDLSQLSEGIEKLQNRLRDLEKRKLEYPKYTNKLKVAIEKEYAKREIDSNVYILSELLEITDERWRNAIEGYFSSQKFYLIVEPEYYDIALEVYLRNSKEIHTAGIVNTKKIKLDMSINNKSLAYVIHSENRYARAYATFVLGRVMRSEDIYDLENHKIAITSDCMLYQGFVVRQINKEEYKNPYIGQHAYKEQIINVKEELEECSQKRMAMREEKSRYAELIEAEKKVNIDILRLYLEAPMKYNEGMGELKVARFKLKEAQNDPTLIELNMRLTAVQERRVQLDKDRKGLEKENGRLENKIEDDKNRIQQQQELSKEKERELETLGDKHASVLSEAKEKYEINRKSKAPGAIYDNFSPRGVALTNERERLIQGSEKESGLIQLQNMYNTLAISDYRLGTEGMRDYYDAKQKLEAVELVKHEESLKKAKEDCERVFKSDFLSKMKENIENARIEFRNLNKSLKDIYYGDDSYRFQITFDKKKESLYRMITSENNNEGFNLWSQAFEAEYKEEMEELFMKLTATDDSGKSIIEEYTDYRSYLDYDIEIEKKDGSKQKFSAVYGVKSGSETQIPYYVAIAASFYQLYRYGNSIRIMMLDEAFDKMDDERIIAMMEFFTSLDLQVLLATPPAKAEIIGEYVDTVLMTMRVGKVSFVEEYEF